MYQKTLFGQTTIERVDVVARASLDVPTLTKQVHTGLWRHYGGTIPRLIHCINTGSSS